MVQDLIFYVCASQHRPQTVIKKLGSVSMTDNSGGGVPPIVPPDEPPDRSYKSIASRVPEELREEKLRVDELKSAVFNQTDVPTRAASCRRFLWPLKKKLIILPRKISA